MKRLFIITAIFIMLSACTTQQEIWFWEKAGRAADEEAFEDEMRKIEMEEENENL